MTCFVRTDGKTVRQWCLEHEVSYGAVWNHLERGMNPNDACREALRRRGQRFSHPKYFYKGKSLVEILGQQTNRYHNAMRRIRNGMSIENALKGII